MSSFFQKCTVDRRPGEVFMASRQITPAAPKSAPAVYRDPPKASYRSDVGFPQGRPAMYDNIGELRM